MEELGKRVLLTHFPPASTLSTQLSAQTNKYLVFYTLIKKITKFSSYIMKFRMEQLQSHAQMRKYFTIYEEADSHIWGCNRSILNFLIYEENLIFFFISVSSVFVLPSSNINKFFSRRVLPSQQGINRKGTVCVIIFLAFHPLFSLTNWAK